MKSSRKMNVNPTSADFKFPYAKRGKCPKFAARRILPPALSAVKHKKAIPDKVSPILLRDRAKRSPCSNSPFYQKKTKAGQIKARLVVVLFYSFSIVICWGLPKESMGYPPQL